jgi:hypothetical protein
LLPAFSADAKFYLKKTKHFHHFKDIKDRRRKTERTKDSTEGGERKWQKT